MKRKFLRLVAIDVIVSVILGLLNYFYLSKIISFSSSLYVGIFFLAVAPIFIVKFMEQRKIKDVEENFPVFLRDFVESVRSGMAIPQAFKFISNNDYRALTPYVKKISAQLDWGISVEKALMKFSKDTKSKLIARTVSSVIEAHRFGGNLAYTFEALSKTAIEVEKLRAERRLYINSQIITGYIIFFVFLGVMIGLSKLLIPVMGGGAASSAYSMHGTVEEPSKITDEYKTIFRNLILIQGMFAGLIIGKMAEGNIVSGMKHSFIMLLISVFTFIMFKMF